MAFFVWDEKYSVGVRELDSQHKTLVDMLNELFEAMQASKANDVIGGIVKRLVDYTKTHFATEERYMQQHGYPDLASQKAEHAKFAEQVMAFKNDFDSGKVSISVTVTSFLKNWLVQHISGSDKKYAPFFASKGVK